MTKVEDLQGIQGNFEGTLRKHPNSQLKRRALADGILTYSRTIGTDEREEEEVTISVAGVKVRRLNGSDDFRRYIRVERGPKNNRDTIIGLIDKD